MTVFTKQRSWVFGLFVTVLLLLLCPEARAAIDVTEADLQAMSHALGFLDTMPRAGSLAVGIVYSAAAPDGKALAQQTADRLSGVTGPNTTKFQPTLIPVETLGAASDHLDALFLMPGVFGSAADIIQIARQRHLLTISDDPSCLSSSCCVLMVRSERRVEIVLDTSLADAVGAHFPSVFLMLVTRK